ncbi:LYR motif-containing protein 2 [Varanus komodoensis]|nr:LYR motif-containing protein 2 [Varanus komodoensis]
MEVLLVGGSGFGVGDLDLVLNGVALPLRDRVRSLGVLLNPELSLEAQVTVLARSTFLHLRLIHQLRPYLDEDCLETVTHALAIRQVPKEADRQYLRDWAREEFKRNKVAADEDTIRMMITQGNLQLQELERTLKLARS